MSSTRAWVDHALEELLPRADQVPGRLHEAMRYAVFGGGKRFRPAVVRLVCEAFGGDERAHRTAARAAAAIELVHTYSLVHDDLPCMDDDDLRRGRPTCHVVFGEALATLVGDALQPLAFELLAGGDAPAEARLAMVASLSRAAGSLGMVGGQVLDIESSETSSTAESVHRLQAMKTAAMVRASAELGALSAGASPSETATAGRFGDAVGLCFQVVDDLLDVTATAEELGKTPGKDAALQRGTAVEVRGFDGAKAHAEALADQARAAARDLGWPAGGLADQLITYTLERLH
ncbi:MAG: polyprenyl synthetase family protein [Planctomycetota bacterium]|nr:polyprenyl synthetase family protein [Planctomycetota bacterium]